MLFKKILKNIGWLLLGVMSIVALYGLAAILLSIIPVNKHPVPGNDITIYIVTNGDHTDIVVPVKNQLKNWSNEIKYGNITSNDTAAKYVAIGWGNKDFFLNTPTWAQFQLSLGLKAIVGLGASAIHAEFFKTMTPGDQCKKITLSDQQYTQLVTYIDNSFKRDINKQVINLKNAHYDQFDAFYDATGRYTLFYTCNTWANDALKACGQKACLWTPFDKGIFYLYKD